MHQFLNKDQIRKHKLIVANLTILNAFINK